MMEKIGVRQVEQPGGIIRHHIGRARDVVVKVDVSMEALVKGLKAEEVGGRACRSGRATALPADGGNIVMDCMESPFARFAMVGQHIMMSDAAREFQVADGDSASWVVGGHKLGSNGVRER